MKGERTKKIFRHLLQVFCISALICASVVTTYFLTIKYTVFTDAENYEMFRDEDNIRKPVKFQYKGKDYFYTSRTRNTSFYQDIETSEVLGFIINPNDLEKLKEKFDL